MLSMLINKINPRALNSGSNISNRLQQIRQQNSLAAHGFVSGNCQSVSYEAFRHCLSDIATPLVCSKKGTTFIFNQQQKVCALIKPPYFDSRGQCQPVRYFLAEGVQLSARVYRYSIYFSARGRAHANAHQRASVRAGHRVR